MVLSWSLCVWGRNSWPSALIKLYNVRNNGKLTFILRVCFFLPAVLKKRTEFTNRGIAAFETTETRTFPVFSLVYQLYACLNSLSYSFHWSHNADFSVHNTHKPACFVVTDCGHFVIPTVIPIEWLFIWGLWFVLWCPCCVGWGAHGVDCRMLLGRFIPIPLDAVYIAWADYQPHPTPQRLRQDVASKTLGKVLGTCLNPFHLTLVTPTSSV